MMRDKRREYKRTAQFLSLESNEWAPAKTVMEFVQKLYSTVL
jgi:hypothetical protein